jgi:hypothetical protein
MDWPALLVMGPSIDVARAMGGKQLGKNFIQHPISKKKNELRKD